MRLELIDTRARLAELEPEWWQLWHRARATPFQSPAWLLGWLDSFAPQAELHVLSLREGQELLALLPLHLFDWQGERWAAPLGAGISDYLDVLCVPEAAELVAPHLRRELERLAQRAARVQLDDVPEGSILRDPAFAGVASEPCSVCPAIELGGSFDAYLNTLPDFLRRNLRQGGARLERMGKVEWRLAGADELQEGLSALFELHSARWRSQGKPGVLSEESVQDFHRRAAPRLLSASALRIMSLTLNGKAVGVVYVLQRDNAHYYASGFAPELYDCSPGSLLIARALSDAYALGKRRFDFLRGAEPYKYHWGASDHFTRRLTLRSGVETRAPL